MPNEPSACAAKKLPITSPTPVALTRKPRPMFPAPRSCFASTTSATLTSADATAAVFQTTNTVTSWLECSTRRSPSRRSLQCPFEIGSPPGGGGGGGGGDSRDERVRGEKGDGIDPVGGVGSRCREQQPARRRADRPRDVLHGG